MKIYLDDERDCPNGYIKCIYPKDVIELLKINDIEEISLDHDLGDDENIGTGYDVIKWIENKVYEDSSYIPPIIKIHSQNPVAKLRMEAAIKNILNMIYKRKIK